MTKYNLLWITKGRKREFSVLFSYYFSSLEEYELFYNLLFFLPAQMQRYYCNTRCYDHLYSRTNQGTNPFLTPVGFVLKGSRMHKQWVTHIMHRQNRNLKNLDPGPAQRNANSCASKVICISKRGRGKKNNNKNQRYQQKKTPQNTWTLPRSF